MAIAVAAIAVAASSLGAAQTALPSVPQQTLPSAPQQSTAETLADPVFPYGGQSFRFFAADGKLLPLESAKKKSSGKYCYIPEDTSPVMLRSDETLAFASLMHGSTKDIQSWNTVVTPEMKLFKLERLFASNDNRRYATGKYVPMNGMVYGNPLPGIDPKHPKDIGQMYISRPAALPPGEYAISVGGMFVAAGDCRGGVSAFRIVQ
jgi:hypothetical protein